MLGNAKKTLVAGLLLGVASTAQGDTLAYVRATSQLQPGESTYHPVNVLDNDPATIWCEGAESVGDGEELRISFKRPQRIDRLLVGPTPKSGQRVVEVEISDGYSRARVHLEDAYVEQRVSPPMQSPTYTITITKVAGPNPSSDALGKGVACLADVILYWKNRPFGGRADPATFRYNKYQDRVLGVWNGGPLGAPEKKLAFALDGTWTWSYDPLMGGKSRRMNGEYRFRGDRLLMRRGETGRWSDMQFKIRDVEVNPDDAGAPNGNYTVLDFNDALGPIFAGEYNNAEF